MSHASFTDGIMFSEISRYSKNETGIKKEILYSKDDDNYYRAIDWKENNIYGGMENNRDVKQGAKSGIKRKTLHEESEDTLRSALQMLSRTAKKIKLEEEGEPMTFLLSGFMWHEKGIRDKIRVLLQPFSPTHMEVSKEMPSYTRERIKHDYHIQSDFLKVALRIDSSEYPLRRAVLLKNFIVQKYSGLVKEEQENQAKARRANPYTSHPVIKQEVQEPCNEWDIRKRVEEAKVWRNLANAVALARERLTGADLDIFEALIARPMPGVNQDELIIRWIRGGN